jgi:hypothetical protein
MKIQLITACLLGVFLGMLLQNNPSAITASEARKSPWDDLKEQVDLLEADAGHLTQYRARWTHPKTIESHMLDHGVAISGKSKSQLLAEHDVIHDVTGPVAAGEPTPQVNVAYQLQECPDGKCPVNRPVVAAVTNAVSGAAMVVHAVAPPYPRLQQGYSQNHGSSGYSVTNYGSGGGYSSTAYSVESYGSNGYSSVRQSGQPVRSFLRRAFGR